MLPPTNLPAMLFRQIREAEERAGHIYEAVIGLVVDNKDEAGLARVKVKFPCFGDPDTSWWAPVVSLGAGEERGWFFLPEIDDEVVVMFEHGDIRRPVVLGAVWNGKDAPPDSNGGGNERRVIVSREGSRITFDDDGGKVILEDGGGAGTITISTENKITIESPTGDICFLAPDGAINVVAKEMKTEAKMNFNLDAKSGIKMASDGKVNLKASGILKVAGSTTDLMPSGGGASPEEVSDSCEEVPDPLE